MQCFTFTVFVLVAAQPAASVRIDDEQAPSVTADLSAVTADAAKLGGAASVVAGVCEKSKQMVAALASGGDKVAVEAKQMAAKSAHKQNRAGELEAQASSIAAAYGKAKDAAMSVFQASDKAASDAHTDMNAKKEAAEVAASKIKETADAAVKAVEAEKLATQARADADTAYAETLADNDNAKKEDETAKADAIKKAEDATNAAAKETTALGLKNKAMKAAADGVEEARKQIKLSKAADATATAVSKKATRISTGKVITEKMAQDTLTAKTIAEKKKKENKALKADADKVAAEATAAAEHAMAHSRLAAEEATVKTAAALAALHAKEKSKDEYDKESMVNNYMSVMAGDSKAAKSDVAEPAAEEKEAIAKEE